jgi:hypothetical protein
MEQPLNDSSYMESLANNNWQRYNPQNWICKECLEIAKDCTCTPDFEEMKIRKVQD